MASPKELDLLSHDKAAARPGAPDLTAAGSFAERGAEKLPVVADDNNGEGAAAEPGATAKASLVHKTGMRHAVVEVMLTSQDGGRVLLRRRAKDDPLAPDTFDATCSAHVLPEDGGDAQKAARRALERAGLAAAAGAALEPVTASSGEHRRIEFPVGGYVENEVVHAFTAKVQEELAEGGKAEGGGGGGGATKAADGVERVWLAKADAVRMLQEEPAVVSPFLAAGKKGWFGGGGA